ncbi:PqqD family protein [Clostridium hydrogeniformans]|uniref:PqqD family protein n=1 Tax=Clostridium hydrogeniformans TaxID=349933 RepID=UPI00048A00D9|nr:PqqD family protein [Clostridium hydrogeniformans]
MNKVLYILSSNYELTKLQDQYVLTEKNSVNTNSNLILLNSTGQLILSNLISEKTLNELLEIISNEFNVEQSTISNDVNNFISNLLSKNILVKKS